MNDKKLLHGANISAAAMTVMIAITAITTAANP
jgi:hypothetical protein